MLLTYYCPKCEFQDVRKFYIEDKIYKEEVLVKSLTQEEIDNLPEWDDPRLYEEYDTVEYGERPPETVKCTKCNKKIGRDEDDIPGIMEGRNSISKLKERQRYAQYGMDKKQANTFYNEAIQASKERVKSGGQHYKRFVPNGPALEKMGLAKKLDSKKSQHSKQFLKDVNRKLTKDGTIGKAGRKK